MLRQIVGFSAEELTYQIACMGYRLSTQKRHPTSFLVNGSPKTGTTWMVKMLSSLPGYTDVGNFERQVERYHQVAPGQIIHGHDSYSDKLKELLATMNIGIVFMVRDPRDQLTSRMFHIKRSRGHPWQQRFQAMDDDTALMRCIEGDATKADDLLPDMAAQVDYTLRWLDSDAPLVAVRYEHLHADPAGELAKVFSFLNVKAGPRLVHSIVTRNRFERSSVGRRVWQAARKPGEQDATSHARKGIVGDWKNYLNAAHIAKIKELLGQRLIDLGYEQDLDW